jgi:hypothetical protein
MFFSGRKMQRSSTLPVGHNNVASKKILFDMTYCMKKGHHYCGWRIAAVLLATAHLLVGWLVFVPKELHRGHDITGSQA